MKPISTRYFPGMVAVMIAASACLAVATVVDAQTPPAPPTGAAPRPPMPPKAPDGKMGPGGPGMRGMHMMREVERLKTSLQLNAQQATLWDRAVAQMKPQGDLREQMKARHDRMAAMLDDPNFDPRRMAAEMERVAAERKAKMTTIRDAWFAVYDSLNPVQRGQVREFLRERMAGHHGMHGGSGHGGSDGPRGAWMHHEEGMGQPPMAPPAR